MSDTPETDKYCGEDLWIGEPALVSSDFARKLERERNEALNKAHNYEQGYLTHAARADTLEKERDEAREAAAMWEKVALREASMNGSLICGKEAAK